MREFKHVRKIPGFFHYLLTRDGELVSLKKRKPRKLKPGTTGDGYLVARMHQDGKTKYLLMHRLVAEIFIDNPENKPEVNHIDGNKTNNHAENLEWCTRTENMDHAFHMGLSCQKLTADDVRFIRQLIQQGAKQVDMATRFGVNKRTISDIIIGKTWKNLEPEG